jgi:hypothetical protein
MWGGPGRADGRLPVADGASRLSDGDRRTMPGYERPLIAEGRDIQPKKNGRASDALAEDEELAGSRGGRVRVTRAWCVQASRTGSLLELIHVR